MNEILCYLDELFPFPKCELNYNKDYEFLIAVVLSAQTTDKSVNSVTSILFKKYNTLEKLSKANIEDIKNIIKPIGTYNKKSEYIVAIANDLLNRFDGIVPCSNEELESIRGVGHKSANVVLSNIYNIPSFAVDTHVSRVSKRLGLVMLSDDTKTIEMKLTKLLKKDRWSRTHHQMVLFGRYRCKAKFPLCSDCKLSSRCKYYNKKNQF